MSCRCDRSLSFPRSAMGWSVILVFPGHTDLVSDEFLGSKYLAVVGLSKSDENVLGSTLNETIFGIISVI